MNHDIGASTVQTETMQEGNLLLDEVCNFPPYIDEYLQNRKKQCFFLHFIRSVLVMGKVEKKKLKSTPVRQSDKFGIDSGR